MPSAPQPRRRSARVLAGGAVPVCMTRHSRSFTVGVASQDRLVCVMRHNPRGRGGVACDAPSLRGQRAGQPEPGQERGPSEAGVVRGVGVLVLTLEGDRIAQITRFGGAALLARFGLPRTLPA